MKQPSGEIIYNLAELGMPDDPPMTPRGFNALQKELKLLCETPRSFNLPLDEDTVAVYDGISETAGEVGDIVGRGLVVYTQKGLTIPERTEYANINKPGLELDEQEVEEDNATKRLLGYVAFKKEASEAEFNGSIQLISPHEVLLEAVCMIKTSAGRGIRDEVWKFAQSIGLGSLWANFDRVSVGSRRTHINVAVGQRMGKIVTDAAKNVRLNMQA